MAFQAAAGEVAITPPVGMDLAGWCFGPSTGVADDLYARCLILQDRGAPLVIITLDLIGLGTRYADRLRTDLSSALSTPRERILVSCSHTHSGPGAMPLRRWGSIDPTYIEQLLSNVSTMVLSSSVRLEPAVAVADQTEVYGICDNRRGDRGNVVDERMPVLVVKRLDGSPIAVAYNFSCHPVAAHNDRNLISADFPGYAAAGVNARFPGAPTLFTLGAAGDVNPVEFHQLELARSYGSAIGDALVELITRATATNGDRTPSPSADAPVVLDALSRVVELPVAALPSADQLREERDRWVREAEQLRSDGGPHSKVEDALIKSGWAAEALEVVEAGVAVSHLSMEIAALRIGPLALIAMPGELFVEIGMNIKADSPFPLTAIVELANGSLAYLPTTEAYRKGGYETEFSAKVYGLYMLTDQTQPIIEQAARELLAELSDRTPIVQNPITQED
jgi:neutral ceramidase